MATLADASIVTQMSNLLAAVRAARDLVRLHPADHAGWVVVGPQGWQRLQAALEVIDTTRRDATTGDHINGS